jgi:hypothetical protein
VQRLTRQTAGIRRRVTNETTSEFLRNYMTEFKGFVARVLTVLPREA